MAALWIGTSAAALQVYPRHRRTICSMRPVSNVTRFWIGLLALAGVTGAHALAFLFVAPDPHARTHLLVETGHSTWFWPLTALFAALMAGCAGSLASRWRSRPSSWLGVACALVSLQLGGFTLLEAAERVTSGGSVTELVTQPVFLVGLVAQVLIALLITGVLSLVVEVVVALRRGISSAPEASSSPQPRPLLSIASPRISPARSPCGSRGPPLHLCV